MGNTGSAHNLHHECVDSELNSYYTQQYLRRTTGGTKKKHNHVVLGGWSSGRNVTDLKVLPKPTENLKLRATTNGAILQAGGTISFRAKEQLDERTGNSLLESQNETIGLQPMRRSQTLILDGQSELKSNRKSTSPLAEFRRAQTLLHIGYNRTKSQENISTNIGQLKSFSPQEKSNSYATTTLKVNKYNKKRKAPPAPTKTSVRHEDTSLDNKLSVESNNTSAIKPRIYTTNSHKISAPLQQQNRKPQTTNAHFQRGSNVRISFNSSRTIQQSNSGYANKLPYRREKSFDAVLLRQKESIDSTDRKSAVPNPTKKQRTLPIPQAINKLEENSNHAAECNEEKQLPKYNDNKTTNKFSSYLKDTKSNEDTVLQVNLKSLSSVTSPKVKSNQADHDIESSENEKKSKHQQSRIPQLKRRFYFGMEGAQKVTNPDISQTERNLCADQDKSIESDDMATLNHNIKAGEDILDNGILVHVRPTLPRRQPETPSFSPVAAWRNLLEEQQRLQHERSRLKRNVPSTKITESPICLTSTSKKNSFLTTVSNWTPQQDLEDDEEEQHEEIGHKYKTMNQLDQIGISQENETKLNTLHTLSLSLPRDVHLQSQMKSSLDDKEQETSLKAGNCWLVPGFNSLQKFKTPLVKNIDNRSNTKCTCVAKINSKRSNYYTQNISDDPKYHLAECEFYEASSKPTTNYHNDNWVLHKSKVNNKLLSAATKTEDKNCPKPSSLNAHSLLFLHPKSLTNICGGKHIVYLPGQDGFNTLSKDIKKDPKQMKMTKATNKRQRQCQEMVRENLQDTSPICNIRQSNVGLSEKITHRFSFQSTVRVLEKRRLAEKLSKDAEIQEAQRLHELEAMKRVEEDFQRKRAPEKANLRNQLRLHLKFNEENEEYRSLPLNINENFQHSQNVSDINNNLFCRAEPDGAVSPSFDFNDNPEKLRDFNYKELGRFDSDGGESETQITDLQCAALLIEPYLHSIV